MSDNKASFKKQKLLSSLFVNGVLILICLAWIVPTLGVLITSFRDSQDIFRTGWWTVFPHKAYVETGQIMIPEDVDTTGPITIDGVTHTFEEWRAGVDMPDGRSLTWFGNRRTRTLIESNYQWVGFSANLTLDNYKNTMSGKEIHFTDGSGNDIMRKGNNLWGAFLNSIAVTVPATIIPIMIAAFAAFGFAW